MAQAKKTAKMVAWKPSWKGLFVAASVTLNIAFVIVLWLMAYTHVMDGMLMREGLNRYCDSVNDDNFGGSSARDKALRQFTCASGDAKQYFENSFNSYLDVKGIKH